MNTKPLIAAPKSFWLVGLFAVAFFASTALAGSLDGSFGSGGKVTTDNFHYDTPRKVYVLPDGKIIVAGQSSQEGFHIYIPSPMLVRYNSNGTLDSTFGTSGKVVAGGVMTATATLIQPDGKIVVAGGTSPTWNTAPNDFGLVRFNPDGSLDSSFGTGGKVVTNINTSTGLGKETIGAVLLLPGGKILALGGSIVQAPPPSSPRPLSSLRATIATEVWILPLAPEG
jgi:uncharacterized delta-60 repeat protein